MYPFFLFILNHLLFLSGIVLCIFSIFIVVRLATTIFDKIVFKKLKNIISRAPNIGLKDEEGNFEFKQGRFTIRYRLIDLGDTKEQKKIEFIAMKRRLWGYEEKAQNFSKVVRNFWLYHEWINFFKPKVFFALFSIILIFYLTAYEPEYYKVARFRWLISRILRVNEKSVTVKPDGWVTIQAQRQTAVDRQIEPISYNVNLFDWITFRDDGYISRYKGRDYGYSNYSVMYDDRGGIKLKKEGDWIEGELNKDRIDWKKPQGTGIREGKVLGHDVKIPEDTILINDK